VVVARVSRRFVLAIVGALACALAVAPAARAGTYAVVACDAAPHGANNSWIGSASPRMAAESACPTGLLPRNGIRATAKVDAGPAAVFATAAQSFDAPPGAAIVKLATHLSMHRKGSHWGVGIYTDGKQVLGCSPGGNDSDCLYSAVFPGTAKVLEFPQGVHRVAAQTICANANGCTTEPFTGGPFTERAGIRLYSTTVHVRDDTLPAVADTRTGGLTDGAWQTGSRYVGYSATDNVGIRLTRFYVDGRLREDFEGACDFTRRAPCGNLPSSRYLLHTQSLADGGHQLRLEAVDTAGNVAKVVEAFRSDNTPPDAPGGVTVDGGEGWRPFNGFRLSWGNPASAAPIVAAHYELCNTAGGGCVSGERRGERIDSIADLAVPEPGDYTVRVWLEDAAGNVNGANRSVPVHLRFDDVPPGQAAPVENDAWTNQAELEQRIEMGIGQAVPVSGVAGYSVTTDGTEPDGTIDTQGGSCRLTALAEGVTTLRARAVSGSGVPSQFVGETRIRVDRTPPTADVDGVPSDGAWQRQPITLLIRGTDQPELAGMTAAPAGDPLESGGYVQYRIDDGNPTRTRGEAVDVTLTGDGDHAVSFRAVDAAGNESDDGTVHVRIDRTAPELVVFEPLDPADPRSVRVAAADRTSGVASGVIEIRPAASGAGWRPLATSRRGASFVAHIDDAVLSGMYELRARVVDGAGNEAVGDRRRDGSPAIVNADALRLGTRLAAGVQSRPGVLSPAATIAFGRDATARGTLVQAGGAPVPGATIEVWSRPATAGAAFRLVGRLRTGPAGAFGYSIARGPSRTLRFRYAGSPARRASQADIAVRVPAAATITASRSKARNGQTVTFRGSVLGRPLPHGGKVVDLQAFYRGRWRTFATPRAGSNGGWRYTYRFGATRGRVVYRFRAMVRRESAYPYELGYSRTVAVTVTG
jgi:hypothetical protein